MNTYIVYIYYPKVYEIEAETQEEAESQALARFKKGKKKIWVEPYIDTWIKPKVYKGKSMHQIELEELEKQKDS